MAADSPPLSPLRTSVGLSTLDWIRRFRISGEGGFALLDRLCSGDLFLRDTQMVHTLMLDEHGVPAADLYVCRDDEAFILLAEERPGFALEAHLRAAAGPAVTVESLDASHTLLGLDGPYAWELMAELAGPLVIGLPYLNLFHGSGWDGFRAGKTGEYGYALLTERPAAAALRERIIELGRPFDLAEVTREEVEQCSLENGFFSIRREGSLGLSPLELQLQWRVSWRKGEFVGAPALKAKLEQKLVGRSTWLRCTEALVTGDLIAYRGREIGRILHAGYCVPLRCTVAIGLLTPPFAYPGSAEYTAGPGHHPIETIAPPVLRNRSLYVSPQRDSYYNRATRTFPELAPPWPRGQD